MLARVSWKRRYGSLPPVSGSGHVVLSLGSRLALGTVAFGAACVPAVLLAYAATHGWAPLQRIDASAANALHDWAERTPAAVGILKGVSNVLDPWVLRAVSLGVVVGLIARSQRRLAWWFSTTIVAAGALGVVLKSIVARSRPVLPEPVAQADGFSFPSGHALNSFVFFGALVLLLLPLVPRAQRRWLWFGAASLVLLVGFARVALGVHFVSDVLGAWIIGAGLLTVTVIAFESWRRDIGKTVPDVLTEGVSPEESLAAGTTSATKGRASRDNATHASRPRTR